MNCQNAPDSWNWFPIITQFNRKNSCFQLLFTHVKYLSELSRCKNCHFWLLSNCKYEISLTFNHYSFHGISYNCQTVNAKRQNCIQALLMYQYFWQLLNYRYNYEYAVWSYSNSYFLLIYGNVTIYNFGNCQIEWKYF